MPRKSSKSKSTPEPMALATGIGSPSDCKVTPLASDDRPGVSPEASAYGSGIANSREVQSPRGVIAIRGARTHNLKNVNLDIPHGSFTVITGVSGSGKSSLAFDTLYSEGQRQYIDSLSPYARQFVDSMPRPDMDSVLGLQPTLCIDQRQSALNPRSTLATIAEVYDYLRLLMARVGTVHCYQCHAPILQQSADEMVQALSSYPEGTRLTLMAPIVRDRKGSHVDVFEKMSKAGLLRARVDGDLIEIESPPKLEVRRNHSIDAVCDRMVLRSDSHERLLAAISLSIKLSDGLLSASIAVPDTSPSSDDSESANIGEKTFTTIERLFSTKYACAACGISYAEIEPRIFSFNSPHGACEVCDGIGYVQVDSNKKSDNEDTDEDEQSVAQKCPSCLGARLRKESLAVKLNGLSIDKITHMPIAKSHAWLNGLELDGSGFSKLAASIAKPILAEMLHRTQFLNEVGVGYLSLDRPAKTLSGGELQRVRLAASIGSGLVGVCYVLDEPSIGLHPRDSDRLIDSITKLRDQRNTVVVVEHDEAMMRAADLLVDMGPGAGPLGGQIMAIGTPEDVSHAKESLTGAYLRGEQTIELPERRLTDQTTATIAVKSASRHNLKSLDVEIPLGRLIGVTGVSGSGKSTLINETLVPLVKAEVLKNGRRSVATSPSMVDSRHQSLGTIEGGEAIDKMIVIDQKSLGRSSRSTPSTYTGLWDEIRNVYAQTRDAKQRGFSAGRFSFNAGKGRCENCQGAGQLKIEMSFLADIFVKCSHCSGRRFNPSTLAVRYKDKNAADVLQMSIAEAARFFENFSKVSRILKALVDVGLGYLSLGQPSHTLSGGEAQRIKLATELSRVSTGKTLYVLDEPTTGLHIADVRRLISVLQNLVDLGNTVIVIEHHMGLIKVCDWIIDLGPDGGEAGGQIVGAGTPESIAANPKSLTGKYLQVGLQ
ncbi:MAG: excinuclease ABC subunit UvrA [Planctomycetota bacterium]|nr:excinuclease ABC subunit UvrA [Planctomycetota bacterium]